MKKSTTTENPLLRTGDLVVGYSDPSKSVYSKTGGKLSQEGVNIYGDETEIATKKELFMRSAKAQGGETISLPRKKVKKTKSKIASHNPEIFTQSEFIRTEEAPTPSHKELKVIQFENQFGKIKAKVEHIIEEELAFMLVFSDEDMVVFEPKVGESLTLHVSNYDSFEVYYPGVTFSYPVGNKKLMILFKIPVENEE